jgi:hypothetical protein
MKAAWAMAAAAAGLAVVVAASAAEVTKPDPASAAVGSAIPTRKPGWWEMNMSVKGPAPSPARQTLHICTDPQIDQLQTPFGVHTGRCPPLQVTRTPQGWDFSGACRVAGANASTTGRAAGDLASRYHVDLVTTVDPPPVPQAARTEISIDAAWLGQCPAGKKPGDVDMTMQTSVAPPPE